MLVIRLQRTGRKNSPSYRLVLAEKSAAVQGKSLEALGHYLPTRDPVVFEYKEERISHWVGKGAAVSDTAARLLHTRGVKGMETFMERYAHRRSKKTPPEEAAPPPAPAQTETAQAEPAVAPESAAPETVEQAPAEPADEGDKTESQA